MNKLIIDVGGTAIKYGMIDENINIIGKGEKPTPYQDLETFLNVIKEIYIQYKDEIDGVGFSMPGRIDTKTGYLYTGGALDDFIHEMNMIEIFKEFIDKPISIGNDAKCAALAEVGYGSLKEVNNSAVMILGTGLGGALIYNREVVNGSHYFAGEFSFVKTNIDDKDNFDYWSGSRFGATGLIIYVEKLTNNKLNGREIFELAKQGNKPILEALDLYTKDLAFFLFNLQAFFDPELVAIGGGISSQPLLFEYLEKNIKETKLVYDMPIPQVVPCTYHNDANLIGAYYMLKEKMHENLSR